MLREKDRKELREGRAVSRQKSRDDDDVGLCRLKRNY